MKMLHIQEVDQKPILILIYYVNVLIDNKNISNLKSYEYYQNLVEDKYEGINEKEFFEMNRNRYLVKFGKKKWRNTSR